VVLQDGFENGALDAWTTTRSTNGESTTVVNDPAYEGTYSAQFTTEGEDSSEIACVYESLTTELNEISVQGHFQLTQNGMSESSDRIKLVELRAGSAIIASAGLWQTGDTICWWMETRDGSAYVESYTAPVTIELSAWFNLEIRWRSDGTTGGGSLWVNGVQIYEINNDDTDNYGGCTQVRIGLTEAYNCASTILHTDEASISNSISDQPQATPSPTEPPSYEPPTTDYEQSDSTYRRSSHYWRNR
jgi:hypothetical protein